MGSAHSTETSSIRTVVGLDIGGSKIAIVEGTPNARILQRREVINDAQRRFDQTFPQLAFVIDELIELSRNAGREAKALSVAVGGPLKIEEGVLFDPPYLPRWHNVRLKEVLADRFPSLAACIERDGSAGALVEFCFGIGRPRPGLRTWCF